MVRNSEMESSVSINCCKPKHWVWLRLTGFPSILRPRSPIAVADLSLPESLMPCNSATRIARSDHDSQVSEQSLPSDLAAWFAFVCSTIFSVSFKPRWKATVTLSEQHMSSRIRSSFPCLKATATAM